MSKNGSEIYVVKKNGMHEPYSEAKVLRSMERVGLPRHMQPQVLQHIRQKLHPGIDTTDIFAHILEFLKDNSPESSLRFNLKQAIFDLGPTGFPFEKYIERVFKSMGYSTLVDQIVDGDCVQHEIDVIVEKDGKKEVIEAKFHNQQGIRTDVQVLLYTHSRFLDIQNRNNVKGVWVVTNTKLSTDATRFAKCKGIKIIGWNYPERNNLQEFVENPKMYPITILNSLTRAEKQTLMQGDVILCKDLMETEEDVLLNKFFLHKESIKKAKQQAASLLNNTSDEVMA